MKALFRFDVICDESKIQKTIAVSKEAFLSEESEQTISHIEFLYQQCKFIKKRWWLMQGLLLAFVCFLLNNSDTDFTVRRILGLTGPLFIRKSGKTEIAMLWKSNVQHFIPFVPSMRHG